ncbi:uncharacterized protein RSE6_13767 [Rhynchosporium secalis]|uniref:Apple domain-containing protein n=1 Tax=Rhynchosporium secalis TaxID=38038 RepID=A0A1E1MTL8_RHYSE|nr:uncharacterized protein RSE6_13767 [Rhynchosporium secalis]
MFSTSSLLLILTAAISSSLAQNCSVKGYDTGKIPAFLLNPNITTATACQTYCSAATYAKCVSFAVGPAACLLYNVTVAGYVNVVPASGYTFWDVGCKV